MPVFKYIFYRADKAKKNRDNKNIRTKETVGEMEGWVKVKGEPLPVPTATVGKLSSLAYIFTIIKSISMPIFVMYRKWLCLNTFSEFPYPCWMQKCIRE